MSRYCLKCNKSRKACICEWITPLRSEIELIILQHPTEVQHPMGTARILSLSLPNCRIIVDENFSDNIELNTLLAQQDVDHYILYPSASSLSLEAIKPFVEKRKVRIILLDGTWKKAFKMWQISSNLQSLPTVALPSDLIGNYRIRKASSEHFLSTVEAGFHILQHLDPERSFTPLLTVFERMIEFQISQMPPGVFERNYNK